MERGLFLKNRSLDMHRFPQIKKMAVIPSIIILEISRPVVPGAISHHPILNTTDTTDIPNSLPPKSSPQSNNPDPSKHLSPPTTRTRELTKESTQVSITKNAIQGSLLTFSQKSFRRGPLFWSNGVHPGAPPSSHEDIKLIELKHLAANVEAHRFA